jgi:hypothetical protein
MNIFDNLIDIIQQVLDLLKEQKNQEILIGFKELNEILIKLRLWLMK